MTCTRYSTIGAILTACMLLASCNAKTPSATGGTSSEAAMMGPESIFLTTSDFTWSDAPAVLPLGAKVAVLEGDPTKAGEFTLRLQFPANYKISPHFHPANEHVTVISGTIAIGMGDTFDESKLHTLPTGAFAMMRKGMHHFAWTKDGAVVQLHGNGPWGLTYVSPTDDPRNATKY